MYRVTTQIENKDLEGHAVLKHLLSAGFYGCFPVCWKRLTLHKPCIIGVTSRHVVLARHMKAIANQCGSKTPPGLWEEVIIVAGSEKRTCYKLCKVVKAVRFIPSIYFWEMAPEVRPLFALCVTSSSSIASPSYFKQLRCPS